MPPRKSLLERSKNWGKNRKTTPMKNTLANRSASVLTKNQVMTILSYSPVLARNVIRAIEHRAKNLQNENIRSFMVNYGRRRRLKNK